MNCEESQWVCAVQKMKPISNEVYASVLLSVAIILVIDGRTIKMDWNNRNTHLVLSFFRILSLISHKKMCWILKFQTCVFCWMIFFFVQVEISTPNTCVCQNFYLFCKYTAIRDEKKVARRNSRVLKIHFEFLSTWKQENSRSFCDSRFQIN